MASEWVSCACVNETLVNRTIFFFTAFRKNLHQDNIQNTVLWTKLWAWYSGHFSYSISQNITNQGWKEWYQIKDIIRSRLTVGVSAVDYWLCAAWSLLIIQFYIDILTISIRRHKNFLHKTTAVSWHLMVDEINMGKYNFLFKTLDTLLWVREYFSEELFKNHWCVLCHGICISCQRKRL